MSVHRREVSVIAIAAALFAVLGAHAWGVDDLSLNVVPGSEMAAPGDTVAVTLDVANLSTAINGVQVLVRYDTAMLNLLSVVPTDLLLTPPASGWDEIYLADANGDVDYAVSVNGGSVLADGPVATLMFQVVAEGVTNVTFRTEAPPFFTKLTAEADNSTILPNTFPSGNITGQCDDGLFCNGLETFIGGLCQSSPPPDCTSLTDQCADGVCNEITDACEAQPINEGLACDDVDLCTTGDTCTLGVCLATTTDCSSLDDVCNVGTCNGATGICEALPVTDGTSCDNGLFCDGTDTCQTGVCVSSGDPCTPLTCDEIIDVCTASIHIAGLEVFYAGRFLDQPDPTKGFLTVGSTATNNNVINYQRGITGIRVRFDELVQFASTPAAAFLFEWTTNTGSTFSLVSNASTAITVTPTVLGGVTVVDIVLNDDHVRGRWLKVTIDAAQVTAGGVELDGELAGNPAVLPSGDSIPGGDAVFMLGSAPGDVTGDRKTVLTDIGNIRLVVNPFLSLPITDLFDVDKSGKVLLTDVGDARLDVNPFFTLPLISP